MVSLKNNPKKPNSRILFYLILTLFAYLNFSSTALNAQYQPTPTFSKDQYQFEPFLLPNATIAEQIALKNKLDQILRTTENPKERVVIAQQYQQIVAEIWPGLFEGYPFNGHFAFSSENFPYKWNRIHIPNLYIDPTGKADIDLVTKNWDRFNLKEMANLSHEANQVYWLKTSFYGSPYFNGEQILRIHGDNLFNFDYIDTYISDRKGGFKHQRTGDKVLLKDQPYNFWANFIKLNIPLKDTLDFFIRLEGADERLLLSNINLHHIDDHALFPAQINEAWKDGLFYGILIFQCIYFLFLFIIEKESIHLYYVLGVFGFFLAIGFSPENFNKFVAFPNWNDYYVPLLYLGLFMIPSFAIKFTEAYFNYSKNSFLSKRVIPIYILLCALVALNAYLQLKTFNPNSYNKFPFILLGVFIFLGVAIIFALAFSVKRQSLSKKYFLLAFTPMLLLCLLFIGGQSIFAILGKEPIISAVKYLTSINSVFYECLFPLYSL